MADSKVGSAYVEVSAKLDKNAGKDIKKGLEDVDVKDSGKKLGEDVGDGIGGGIDAKSVAIGNIVANVVTAAAQKAAQLIGDVIGGAFENYANYQQLTGGVEKLFGDSSSQVMQYAQQAYQTAGLSANDYMEQVTSFSASLISSLDGDTAEAARIADMAIRDMSDNANVFGTDIQSIQNAYQGFAKGQFTMLDNLKLGYGGTKTEMERLLADAEAISGVHYDINQYSDIAEAIHVVQTEMAISGTTAAEAAGTISGSMSMLSASWQNWLTAVGGGGDLKAATQALVDSLSTMAENALPELGTIIGNLIKEIPNFVAVALEQLPSLATNLTSALFGDEVGSEVAGFFEELQPTIDAVAEAFGVFVENMQPVAETLWPAMQELGGALLVLLQGIGENIIQTLPIITSFLQWIAPYLAEFMSWLAGAIEFFVNDLHGTTGALVGLQAIVETVGAVFETIATAITTAWTSLVEFFRGIPSTIQGFFASIGAWFSAKFGEVKEAIVGKIREAVEFVRGIPEQILGFFTGIGSKIGDAFGQIHVPLPHFSISPAGWQIGDLLKGSIPSLSIEWYARGGIVDGATLIGAGEAGREAIVPLENRSAMRPFAAAVAQDMDEHGTFADMLAVLIQIRDKDSDVYMDGAKVGRIVTPYVNRNIGNRSVMSSRGASYAF